MAEKHELIAYGAIPIDDGATHCTVCRCLDCGMIHMFFDLDNGDRVGSISLPQKAAGEIGAALIRITTQHA